LRYTFNLTLPDSAVDTQKKDIALKICCICAANEHSFASQMRILKVDVFVVIVLSPTLDSCTTYKTMQVPCLHLRLFGNIYNTMKTNNFKTSNLPKWRADPMWSMHQNSAQNNGFPKHKSVIVDLLS